MEVLVKTPRFPKRWRQKGVLSQMAVLVQSHWSKNVYLVAEADASIDSKEYIMMTVPNNG